MRIGRVFDFFVFLAVFISCLGLFGLVSFTVSQKVKEIGIRKVFGASVSSIILMLLKEFMKWILIANIIAWPIAWLYMRQWLNDFAFKTSLNPWIFLLSGLIVLLISMITLSFQAQKAFRINPAISIKYE